MISGSTLIFPRMRQVKEFQGEMYAITTTLFFEQFSDKRRYIDLPKHLEGGVVALDNLNFRIREDLAYNDLEILIIEISNPRSRNEITNAAEISDAFNSYFTSIGEKLRTKYLARMLIPFLIFSPHIVCFLSRKLVCPL